MKFCKKSVLFLVYVNNIPAGIESDVSLFTGVELMRIQTDEDRERLQKYLDKLQSWSDKWLLEFKIECVQSYEDRGKGKKTRQRCRPYAKRTWKQA